MTTVEEKFAKALEILGDICPALLSFYVLLKKEETGNIQTMRLNVTDSAFVLLEYNPDFVGMLNATVFSSLLGTELLRLVHHHVTMRRLSPAEVFGLASYMTATAPTVSKALLLDGRNARPMTPYLPTYENLRYLLPKDFDEKNDLFLEKIFKILLNKESQMQKIRWAGRRLRGKFL